MKAARGSRFVIALVGRRNAGKSSLINAIAEEDIAIVSATAGTTTDPVGKPYELLPLGPVTFYDTAGLDDQGELGEQRMKATRKVLWRTDIAMVVTDERGMGEKERAILAEIEKLDIPCIVVFNKTDLAAPTQADQEFCQTKNIPFIAVSAAKNNNIRTLKDQLVALAPQEMKNEPVLAGDLFVEGDHVVLVVPIDLAAPKGRLILPQVMLLREILDCDGIATVVKEREIEEALNNMVRKPALVVTDSQAILKVSGDVPTDIPLTTFSTLFARYKGDLSALSEGANAIDSLKDGDKILIAESCAHHVQADDIGRVKIPRWISQYTGCELEYDVFTGHDFPENLEDYALVVHCGSCMHGRMEMLRRIRECTRRNVAITNYGICISKVQGVLDRVLQPFYKTGGLT